VTVTPPSSGRGARPRILVAARELFGARGINATGIVELCAAAHVSKRTLYQHFPGKDDVVVAYLAAWEDDPLDGADALLARDELAPRARLLELFDALADGPRPLRGDPFAAAAVELADPRHPAHRYAAARRERFVARLSDLAREAGARDAERVGRRLALLYDGAAAQTVIDDDPTPAAEARAMAAALLGEAIDDTL
jgi:AcrR family transcriptional regulator